MVSVPEGLAVSAAVLPAGGCARCGARLAGDNDGELCSSCLRRLVAEPPRMPRGFWDDAAMRDALAHRPRARMGQAGIVERLGVMVVVTLRV